MTVVVADEEGEGFEFMMDSMTAQKNKT